MGCHMKKVQTGQKLSIPAAAYNAFIDAALDYRRRTAGIGQQAEPSFRQSGIVLIRNDSGSDQSRLAVLGIDSPIIGPTSNEDEFKNRVALSCVTPVADTHEGRFVILVEPISAGKIGRAYADGLCPVRVQVEDEDHGFADVKDGDTSCLESRAGGAAQILWKEAGTGLKWAIVRLSAAPAAMFAEREAVNLDLSVDQRQVSARDDFKPVDRDRDDHISTRLAKAAVDRVIADLQSVAADYRPNDTGRRFFQGHRSSLQELTQVREEALLSLTGER